jgi:hypothetical protein
VGVRPCGGGYGIKPTRQRRAFFCRALEDSDGVELLKLPADFLFAAKTNWIVFDNIGRSLTATTSDMRIWNQPEFICVSFKQINFSLFCREVLAKSAYV